jgi:hypothetical protein
MTHLRRPVTMLFFNRLGGRLLSCLFVSGPPGRVTRELRIQFRTLLRARVARNQISRSHSLTNKLVDRQRCVIIPLAATASVHGP